MGNYFHSLITTARDAVIGFIVLILFLSVRWLQRQLSGRAANSLHAYSERRTMGQCRGSVCNGKRAQ